MNIAFLILALVPWIGGQGYTRLEPDVPWYIHNDGTPSQLFLNDVWLSTETGTNDLNMIAAWSIQSRGVKVGVLSDGAHGERVVGCVRAISPRSEVYASPTVRWYAENVAQGVSDCVQHGCRVIVVSGGYGENSAILRTVLSKSRVIVIIAAPDQIGNLDGDLVEWPYRWRLPNVLYVNSTDRNGDWYWSATGTNCVAAPGRNIVSAGTYASGTSYAAPIVAGVAALVWAKNLELAPREVIFSIRATATPDGPIRRINATAALQLPR